MGSFDSREQLCWPEVTAAFVRRLDRRDAELLFDRRAKAPRRRSGPDRRPTGPGCRRHSRRPPRSARRQARAVRAYRIDRSMARGELGPAAQARPEAVAFRQGRIREEAAAIATRTAGRADRTTINAGRRHTDKEQAVKTSVSSSQRTVADLVVNVHGGRARFRVHSDSDGGILYRAATGVWPFSDIEMESCQRSVVSCQLSLGTTYGTCGNPGGFHPPY